MRYRSLKPGVLLLGAALAFALPVSAASSLPTFSTEAAAKEYCRGGGVVWVDLSTGQYVYKGSKFYGKGKKAAFACEMDILSLGGKAAQTKP